MSIDTITHRAELTRLANAFAHISGRNETPEGRQYWRNQERQAVILGASLGDLHQWTRSSCKVIVKQLADLALITASLIDRVSTPDGRQFWQDQTALLNGLADHFGDLLTPSTKPLNQAPQPTPQPTPQPSH